MLFMTSTMDRLLELAIGLVPMPLVFFLIFLPVPPLRRGLAADRCWFTLIWLR